MKPHFLFCTLVLVTSCGVDERTGTIPLNHEVYKYALAFREEGHRRGIEIDVSQEAIVFKFGNLDKGAGGCRPDAAPKVITIDSITWRHLTPNDKEHLVYHELAHCMLDRKHDNDKLALGECRSWMRGGPVNCSVNTLNSKWREYYLDELFDANTASPEWYSLPYDVMVPDEREVFASVAPNQRRLFDLDSISSGRASWSMNIDLDSVDHFGSYGISLNEYLLEVMAIKSNETITIRRTVMLGKTQNISSRIIATDTASNSLRASDMQLLKIDKTIYVLLGDKLSLCIPLPDSAIRFSYYSTFNSRELAVMSGMISAGH